MKISRNLTPIIFTDYHDFLSHCYLRFELYQLPAWLAFRLDIFQAQEITASLRNLENHKNTRFGCTVSVATYMSLVEPPAEAIDSQGVKIFSEFQNFRCKFNADLR